MDDPRVAAIVPIVAPVIFLFFFSVFKFVLIFFFQL